MLGANTLQTVEDSDMLIELVKDYALLLQDGEVKQAEYILREIRQSYYRAKASLVLSVEDNKTNLQTDDGLYRKVGRLTRDLHESINDFVNDTSLHKITNEKIPDARQRLNHVVELTEKSAHTTMNIIENINPPIQVLTDRSAILMQQFLDNKEGDERENPDFLNEEIIAFLSLVTATSKTVSNNLNEIMLAQDYQDITGQIIHRVGNMVKDVEDNLLSLLKISNAHNAGGLIAVVNDDIENHDASDDDNDSRGFGPAIPGVDNGNVMHSQEDVDDLLSSMGF